MKPHPHGSPRQPLRASRRARHSVPSLEGLERRLVLSNVTTFRYDNSGVGQNAAETVLTPANVNATTFGKLSTTSVDGYVYAEPLVMNGVNVTTGPYAGVHNVAFVATEHDSLYAIDTDQGTVLWQDSFINPAAGVTTLPQADVVSTDLQPEVGITGTPVIDPTTNTLYLVARTKELGGGVTHYVQSLHAIDLGSGAEKFGGPMVIADTSYDGTTYTYNSGPTVFGTGEGAITDPTTGRQVVPFNALRENQRAALTLANGTVYITFASHGDNGPYHGWVLGYSAATLQLTAALNLTPNGDEGGVWESGDSLAVDAQGNLYLDTGNGTFDTTLNAAGFPINGDYGDSFVKLAVDPTSSPTNQNINGWGLKVVDYFTPYNEEALQDSDTDLGSGGITLLPDAAGSATAPHLLVGGGKGSTLYLINRDNMGKFDPNADHTVQDVPAAVHGVFDVGAYFNNTLYYVGGYGDSAKAFLVQNGTIPAISSYSPDNFGFPGSSPVISSNQGSNAIVWDLDPGSSQLRAYNASNYGNELYTSDQAANQRDHLGKVVKFSVPTVVNGKVYVGTANSLVIYGLLNQANQAPAAPSALTATAVSSGQINLAWTDNSNNETGFAVDESTDGMNFTQIGTTGPNLVMYSMTGLQPSTTYTFRVRAINAAGSSFPSNTWSATTMAAQAGGLDYSSGFAGATGLALNGSAQIAGSVLRLTDGGAIEAGSAFASTPVTVSQFTTQFSFQLTNPNADGFAFVIQGVGAGALGQAGGGLGYGPLNAGGTGGIPNSVALKFDLYDNGGEGPDSTGVYYGGAAPIATGSVDLRPLGLDLHSGHLFNVALSYDGTRLTEVLTDSVTGVSFSQLYYADVVDAVGGSSAYVGFTAGTGYASAVQDIRSWTYNPTATGTPPAAPSGLTATPVSGNQVNLAWTDNSNNETGFIIDRQDSPNGPFNVVGNVGAGATSMTDGGPTPGSTYTYRVRATNGAGDSAPSNTVTITMPTVPATPSQAHTTLVAATQINLAWNDNANNETGYKIFRQTGTGTFNLVASLPPNTTNYTDTGLTAATKCDYHIQAYNTAGYSDFTGVSTTTVPLAPTGASAAGRDGQVALSWSAVTGAGSYNVYRATTTGGEGSTPLATGLTTPSFTDTGLTNGVTYYYVVTAVDEGGESTGSTEVNATPASAGSQASVLNYAGGFAGATGLSLNGSARINGNVLRITDGGAIEAGSVFSAAPVPVSQFTTQFSFQLTNANGDGFAFVIQGVGAGALGQAGGGLGYGPLNAGGTGGIPNSVAVKFDLYDNSGEGPDSTGLYTGGAAPMGSSGSVDLRPLGLDLHSGHVFNVSLSYNGTTLAEMLTDTTTGASTAQSYTVNIPGAVGGSSAYVGFTAGTGYSSAVQDIQSWTYSSSGAATPPAAPSGLAAAAVSGTQANLTWTDNSNNETGFKIARQDSPGGPFNVIATAAAGATTFSDPSLTPGNTYTYQVQATNGGGDSAASNTVAITMPTAPATPSQGRTTLVAATQINLAWNDNANNETGYKIFRQTGTGTFNLVATLPPDTTTYSDTGLNPATSYGYHIQAYNTAGSSDFTGVSAMTAPLPPNSFSAADGDRTVALTWSAAPGATSYNVYRTTASGGASSLVASGVTGTSFIDTGLTNGVVYYYRLTAIDAGGESAPTDPVAAIPRVTSSQGTVLNYPSGFAGATGLAVNGSARVSGGVLRLTDGGAIEAGGAFATTPVPVSQFTTQFAFQLTNANADGFAFVIQGVGAGALGQAGGGLGYGPSNQGGTGGIPKSVAVKFDLYDNSGEGPDSTGLSTGGAAPMATGSVDLRPSGLDLHSGHIFNASLSYNGTVLTEVLTDTATGASATKTYPVDIVSAVGGPSAYVGFTGGTGYSTAVQDVRSWSYTVPSINLPNGFAGATGLALNGATAITNGALRLTNGGPIQAGSAFATTPVSIAQFTTQFSFQLTTANADGFAFVIQGVGAGALGQAGGGLGYGPSNPGGTGGILNSVAVKFDLYDNGGEGPDSTGVYTGGAAPMGNSGSVDLRPLGLDLHSGHVFNGSLGYNGSALTETLTDTTTGVSATKTYTVDIVGAVGASSAFVGFTGGTGYSTAVQDIRSWTYTPAAPTATTASASASGTSAPSLMAAPAPAAPTAPSAVAPVVPAPSVVVPPTTTAPMVNTRGTRIVAQPHPRPTPVRPVVVHRPAPPRPVRKPLPTPRLRHE